MKKNENSKPSNKPTRIRRNENHNGNFRSQQQNKTTSRNGLKLKYKII